MTQGSRRRMIGISLLLSIALTACHASDARTTPGAVYPAVEKPEGATDAAAVGGLATVIDLQWQALGQKVDALAQALPRLCAQPDATALGQTRDVWNQTRRAWMEAQLYEIGPMAGQRLSERLPVQMAWWPANPLRIEERIADEQALSDGFLAREGATVKGIFTLEYLLWPGDGDDKALLVALAPGPGEALSRRCAYATAVAVRMREAWISADKVWRSPTAAGASAAKTSAPLQHFADQQDFINAVVNRMVFVTQELDGMLARPLGRRSQGTPQPEALHGRLSRSSVATILDGLCGIRVAWHGTRGGHCDGQTAVAGRPFPALSTLTRNRSPEIAEKIDLLLDRVIGAVQALDEPLEQHLSGDVEKVKVAFQALKDLQRAFGTELVGSLGVNLTFNANDGD